MVGLRSLVTTCNYYFFKLLWSEIAGYVINYKRNHGDWEELQISARTDEHMLRNLWCGTKYLLYITAFNRIGTGLPCDIVPAQTKGTGK